MTHKETITSIIEQIEVLYNQILPNTHPGEISKEVLEQLGNLEKAQNSLIRVQNSLN